MTQLDLAVKRARKAVKAFRALGPAAQKAGQQMTELADACEVLVKAVPNFKKAGQKGGLTRSRRYSKKQIREWAKLGGRPRKHPQEDDDKNR